MAAIGPAELDLGWFVFLNRMYTEGLGTPVPDGFLDRDQTVARYAELADRPVADFDFFEILAGIRVATVIMRIGNLMIEMGMVPADNPMPIHEPGVDRARLHPRPPGPRRDVRMGHRPPLSAELTCEGDVHITVLRAPAGRRGGANHSDQLASALAIPPAVAPSRHVASRRRRTGTRRPRASRERSTSGRRACSRAFVRPGYTRFSPPGDREGVLRPESAANTAGSDCAEPRSAR